MIFRLVVLYLSCFASCWVFVQLFKLTSLQEKVKIIKQTASTVGVAIIAFVLFLVVFFFGNLN